MGRGKGECWVGRGGGDGFPVCRTIMGGRVDSYPFDQPALPAFVGCVSRYRFFIGPNYKTIPQTMGFLQIGQITKSYPKEWQLTKSHPIFLLARGMNL